MDVVEFHCQQKNADSGNIYGEILEDTKMQEVNSGRSGIAETEIASFEPIKENKEEVVCITEEECIKESNLVIEGEEEKENANVEIDYDKTNNIVTELNYDKTNSVAMEITSSEPIKMKGAESVSILGANENKELGKESNAGNEEEKLHVMEELNTVENANDDVVHEEDAREVKNEGQLEVVSKKRKGKFNKKGKKVLKKKIALKGTNAMIVKDTKDQQPLNKENCQMVEGLNNKENDADVVHEDDAKEEVKNEEKTDEVSKKTGKLRKKQKGLKKKIALKGVNEVINNGTNDLEALNKIAPKKAKVSGMIFMCSSKTKKDCYHYKVLGLPPSKRDLVLNIYEGMKLFLFDFDLKLLYGIYRAAGPGGYNIEPKAFKSAFPSQVRFNVYEDCLPQPEEKFKKVIKDNYYMKNKFDCQLTSEQVKNLCKLFQAASKGSKSKGSRRDLGAPTHKPLPRDLGAPARKPLPRDLGAPARKPLPRDLGAPARKPLPRDLGAPTRKPLPRESRRARREGRPATFTDQDRSRKRPRGAENRAHEDRDRSRKQLRGTENRTFEDRDRTRDLYRDAYEGEVYASPVVPAPSRPLLLPPPSALVFPPRSYAYERNLEMNGYRRDPLVEHQDNRFRNTELGHREQIDLGRNSFREHRDGWFLDSELRRHRGKIEHHDPPVSRDRLLYDDHLYTHVQPSEYRLHPRTSSLHRGEASSRLRAASPQSTRLYDQRIGTRSWY